MSRIRLLLLLLCFPLVVGCDGCRNDDTENQADKDKPKEPLEDFSSKPALVFPGDANPRRCGIKPGHWMTAAQTLKSNKVDIHGDLVSRSSVVRTNFESGGVNSHQQDGLQTQRRVMLPKAQQRRFDFRILTPAPTATEQRQFFLSSRFLSSGRATFFDTGKQPFSVMSGQEYFFVVLTKRPERFAAFQIADWVRPPRDELDLSTPKSNYRIVVPDAKGLLPLPETMLDMTSTAIVFWDDLGPEALTPQQSMALSDWIRFGGQLVVNGANASDSIAKSSLSKLLPLIPTGNIELDPDAANEMLTNWQVKTDRTTQAKIENLRSQLNRIAVDGKLTDGAVAVPKTSNLIVEKRFGRGRVIQPRFDVTDGWLQDWDSYDSFINSVVLLRPRRKTIESNDVEASRYSQQFVDLGTDEGDAALNTQFRISARDAILSTTVDGEMLAPKQSNAIDQYFFSNPVTGVSAWNDDSDTLRSSKKILTDASGIEIPDASLVVRSLGYYLLILVPVNYLLFRLLGKLEYAWLAVPVIALGGAVWVARAARLDIGFACSQTEIAFLELQPDYQRGHLSRVVAIYNSLSDTYEIAFKTADAAAKPITDGDSKDTNYDYVFRTSYDEGPSLSGFSVGSNRIRMVHTEQVIDVGGAMTLSGNQLINASKQELLDVFVIDKSLAGDVRIASVGLLSPESTQTLKFEDREDVLISEDIPMNAGQLLSKIAAPVAMRPGTTRLVGRIDQSMGGMAIVPSTNQTTAQTIVLAHLKHASFPAPKPDLNLISDLRKVITGE